MAAIAARSKCRSDDFRPSSSSQALGPVGPGSWRPLFLAVTLAGSQTPCHSFSEMLACALLQTSAWPIASSMSFPDIVLAPPSPFLALVALSACAHSMPPSATSAFFPQSVYPAHHCDPEIGKWPHTSNVVCVIQQDRTRNGFSFPQNSAVLSLN